MSPRSRLVSILLLLVGLLGVGLGRVVMLINAWLSIADNKVTDTAVTKQACVLVSISLIRVVVIRRTINRCLSFLDVSGQNSCRPSCTRH